MQTLHSKVESKTSEKKYICQNCTSEFSYKSGLSKHKKKCSLHTNENSCDRLEKMEKMIETLMKTTEQLSGENNKLKQERIESLENDKKYFKLLVKDAGNVIQSSMRVAQTSVSALTYANINFTTTPPLREHIDSIIPTLMDNSAELLELIMVYETPNKITKQLADHLINYYKKNDPTLQPIWSCDTTRSNYIVRNVVSVEIKEELPTKIGTKKVKIIDNQEIKEEKLEWSKDKNGTKLRKMVITPLLKHIEDTLIEYTGVLNGEMQQLDDVNEMRTIMKKQGIIGNVMMEISNGSIENEIVKLMAPPLFLDTNMLLKYENNE